MPVREIYDEFRDKFPDLTKLADQAHIDTWDEVSPETAHAWFESLAKVLNREMANGTPVKAHLPVFEYLRAKYLSGDAEEKNCIDASFVENLFWQIKRDKAEPYWQALPALLKDLYVEFHGNAPV